MRRASDFEGLERIRRNAVLAWKDLFGGNFPLVCTGMSTCGISAQACQTEDALKAELAGRDYPVKFMEVGCLGLCYAEPLVYIKKPGLPMVCYGFVTPDVGPSLVSRVI